MLFGREAGLMAVGRALGRARFGCASALVIRSEAGLGKSALLERAAEQANGMTVLSVQGHEAQSENPFAALATLIRPVLPLLGQLPAPQAAVLRSALRLGPAVHVDRFALCAATLSLFTAAAEQAPTLVLVDDLQWLDASSREAILFAGRRLADQGIALLITLATELEQGSSLERQLAGLPQLTLQGLDRADSRALARSLVPGISPDQFEQIYADTAGNPLGIHELCATLDQRACPPRPGQASLIQALADRLAELPERTRRALLLVAAAGGGRMDTVRRAAEATGLELADFAPAERAGLLLTDDGQVRLRHPLLRSVLDAGSTEGERTAAHCALAQALAQVPGEAAARARHLARAVPAPDEKVSELLIEAGARAKARGGNAEAAKAFEQAARFGLPAVRPALLVRAARCWQLAGHAGKVIPLLDEALELTDDPKLRALIRHMRGYVRMWRALPRDGLAEMIAGAREVEQTDPSRAALMYADASIAHFMLGEPVELLAAAGRAFELSEDTAGVARLVAAVAYSGSLVINGHRAEGQKLLDQVVPLLLAGPPLPRAQEFAHAALIAMWLEDFAVAEKLLAAIIDRARADGALGVLPQALAIGSELASRLGRWRQSQAYAQESLDLAEQTRQASVYGLYFLGRNHAVQGRARDAVRTLKATTDVTAAYGATGLHLQTTHALGLLALGQGDPDTAIAHLEATGRLPVARHTKDQSIVPWAFDLVEAYAAAGRTAQAQHLLDEIAVDQAPAGTRSDLLIARTWRCRGLITGSPAAFERALTAHQQVPQPFELARTLLGFGECRRVDRHRAEARVHLRQALEIFEQLGADDWAGRARSSLNAVAGPPLWEVGVAAPRTPEDAGAPGLNLVALATRKVTGQKRSAPVLTAGGPGRLRARGWAKGSRWCR